MEQLIIKYIGMGIGTESQIDTRLSPTWAYITITSGYFVASCSH